MLNKESKKILIILFLTVIFTFPFWITNFDIKIQQLFYENNVWKYQNSPFVIFIYDYAIYPALILGIVSIFIFGFSFILEKLQKYKKEAIIILLTLLLGPGLIVNVICKNYTGRPRPRDIVEFNGNWKYKNVCEFGIPGKGHSFPCGHASMGFVFYSLYVILREKKKFSAYLWLAFAIIFGFLIGVARMMQGAHFLSDVVWAAGLTFISAEIAAPLANYIDKIIGNFKNMNFKVLFSFFITLISLFFIIFIFLLATPFYKERKYEFSDIKENLILKADIDEGNIKVKGKAEGDTKITMDVSGFAMPKRKYDEIVNKKDFDDKTEIFMKITKNGLFSELNSSINFEITALNKEIIINNKKGDIECETEGIIKKCILYTKNGDITFSLNKKSKITDLYLKTKNGDIFVFLDKDIEINGPADFYFFAPSGNVVVYNASEFLYDLTKEKNRVEGAKEIIFKSKEANGINLNIIAKRISIK